MERILNKRTFTTNEEDFGINKNGGEQRVTGAKDCG